MWCSSMLVSQSKTASGGDGGGRGNEITGAHSAASSCRVTVELGLEMGTK